LFLR